MTLNIKYSLEKDAENFIKGSNSLNSKVPTKLQEEFVAINSNDFSEVTVEKFLREKGIGLDFEKKINEINNQWKPIEEIFTTRCEKLFGIPIPSDVVGYVSLNQRCTYNWRENYFFIHYGSSNPLKTIMHELLHFYTHRKYDSLNLNPDKFNDIKESLTVLLNIDFADLMCEMEDVGYPQHKEMREEIKKMREKGLVVDEIVQNLIER